MDRFPLTAEDREEQVIELIDARIHAIKHDIRVNRVSTVEAVLARLPMRDEAKARQVLLDAVVGHSAAVGIEDAGAVELAIFQEAEQLAERDVADMERNRAASRDDGRIERATWAREFA